MSWPIRLRLTAWFAGLLAATLIAFGTFLVLQLRADLSQETDQEVRRCSLSLAQAVRDDGDEPPGRREQDMADDFSDTAAVLLPDNDSAAQVLTRDGRVVLHGGAPIRTSPLLSDVSTAIRAAEPRTVTLAAEPGTQPRRYRVLISDVSIDGRPRFLVVAISLERIEKDVRELLVLLLVGGPVAVAGTALGGHWLARKALRPLDRMTSDAQEIRTDRLHERVAVPVARDELRRLAETLNAMLDRIEHASEQQRQLIADTSHELRTPLTVMRTELDVSLRADELPLAAREMLTSAREEVDRMSRTVDNLLTLAAVDEGRLELFTATMDLREVVDQAAAPLRHLATGQGVRLDVSGASSQVRADRQRLHLALSNLIENAIKFAGEGGVVRVHSWERADEVGVTVTDDGPGVSTDDSQHLFDRFFRVGDGGTGLGLAICREVAEAHGGRVWVDSELGRGSAFSLALPLWRALPAENNPFTSATKTVSRAAGSGQER